ncbi:MAG: hypothetical protein ACE5GK_00595 [Nitrospiria bacterium]
MVIDGAVATALYVIHPARSIGLGIVDRSIPPALESIRTNIIVLDMSSRRIIDGAVATQFHACDTVVKAGRMGHQREQERKCNSSD